MESVDIEAKTIDDAIAEACRHFQTTRDKLNIEILAEGNAGFLGFGSKKAHIRAGILQIDRELDHLINGNANPPSLIESALPQIPSSSFSAQKSAAAREERSAATRDNVKSARPYPSPGIHPRKQDRAVLQTQNPGNTGNSSLGHEDGIQALELVEGILMRMNIPARIKMNEEADTVILTITGDGDGLLIGKRGQNLDAIQYLVNKAIHHTRNGGKRIVIDTEEYRKRRESALQSTALQIAQKVRKTHKPMTLAPMNPHDRRIIHIALKNEKSLTTKSRGEGEFRKIVITPV